MALLAKKKIVQVGVDSALAAAAAGGDTFVNDQKDGSSTFIIVNNTGGVLCNVTVDDPLTPTPSGATAFNPDMLVAVAAGTQRAIGPIPAGRFNTPNTDIVAITYSQVVGVTVGVFYI